MLTKRIIPCLDVSDGRVVKGLNFKSLRDAGDPVELAKKYSDDGADELVFLDITASEQGRETLKGLVRNIAKVIDIPFTYPAAYFEMTSEYLPGSEKHLDVVC